MTRKLEAASAGPAVALGRIAEVLGMPVDVFFDVEPAPSVSAVQVVDLVTAFAAIDDRTMRELCLAFVRAAAGVDQAGSSAGPERPRA